jgi:hypothetical protein
MAHSRAHFQGRHLSPGGLDRGFRANYAAITIEQRRRAELSPGGYGIHWPLLDEDISIGGLVG